MVIRVWIIAGAAFIVVAWLLTVPLSPGPFQGSAPSQIEAYRAEGLVPEGALIMSRSIGHEIFEVPAEDAEHAQMPDMSMPSSDEHTGMPGMSMPADQAHDVTPGMRMEPDQAHEQMPGMNAQNEPAEAHHQMPGMTAPQHDPGEHGEMPGMNTQNEPADAHGQMPGMTAPQHDPGEHGEMPGMVDSEEGHGDHGAGGGLRVLMARGPEAAHAREVRLQMREWGFVPSRVDVAPGEVVRLFVRNTGNNPHEFMLMSHTAMAAVNYRLQRADWNLLEHEALYEREIVMPGDAVEVTLRVEQPGAWMFMCMFPYHMQLGMMGIMATEGQGMDMEGMHM
ncbi:MAG TPA: cupredoxin domain-containing protein [Gammaproteobacteria bacterium]|nr:cupredoxin domain-containing protein [Gammaproteobacteria bacterium]